MSVPLSNRRLSKFQADKTLQDIAIEVEKLSECNFGFSPRKFDREIERYANAHRNAPNVDELVSEKRGRLRHFVNILIPETQQQVTRIVQNAIMEFGIANSIFPSDTIARDAECVERRIHMDKAIGYCFALEKQLQFMVLVLPIDANRMDRIVELIDTEINLLRGVRQADNRFSRPRKEKPAAEQ